MDTQETVNQMIASGEIEKYAWPGGYPLFYIMEDGSAICPDCLKKNLDRAREAREYCEKSWHVVGYEINWEDDSLLCDECNAVIESAYGEN